MNDIAESPDETEVPVPSIKRDILTVGIVHALLVTVSCIMLLQVKIASLDFELIGKDHAASEIAPIVVRYAEMFYTNIFWAIPTLLILDAAVYSALRTLAGPKPAGAWAFLAATTILCWTAFLGLGYARLIA
jgi:hypothetical protein